MRKDGGSAFPCASSVVDSDEKTANGFSPLIGIDVRGGMSLRDYFAASALQGLCANGGINVKFETRTRMSYEFADFMLAERNKSL